MSEVQKILRIEPQDVGCKVMKLIDINEAEQALYDLLMEKMPKKRKIPAFSLLAKSKNKGDVALAFDGGYNQAIKNMKSAINELFGRTG